MSLSGRVLGGRYKLDKHLADGGMGAVWTGQDCTLGVPVAVKLMSGDCAKRADLRARFVQEAKAVALLRNTHVVQVLDYGTDDDTPFIVMELLDGIDLLASLEKGDPWPLPEVAGLVIQAAQGLAVAHRAGLIHRDVKPANIFLARTGDPDAAIAKIIDFGIAKWLENSEILTAANVALGSPSYMSPEQIRGQKVDARVDAWALAVVAFAMVANAMPFVGRNGPDIAKQVVMGNRRKIPEHVPNAHRFERFFNRAFAADSAARHRSVEELAGEFVLAAGAPSPLRTAARAVAEARGAARERTETVTLPRSVDDAVTNKLVRSTPKPVTGERTPDPRAAQDLEETVIEDGVSPSAGAAGRNRSSG